MAVVQTDLLCPNCAGQCTYSPTDAGLSCASCGEVQDIPVDHRIDAAKEFHYHPDLPHTEQPVSTGDTLHECETCKGRVVFTGPVLSGRCAYRDGPVVQGQPDASYQTVGMIPFTLSDKDAQRRLLDWVRKRCRSGFCIIPKRARRWKL